ncbi:MAG: hypothetical protein K2N85_07320, partial [Lachnospiraceae bacterium]|nr:hypothetical protein [Lachnospiraceae bacterium]
MKFVKRISLFFIMAGMMFGAGSYATYKAEQFFYPKKYEQQNEKIPSIETEDNSGSISADVAKTDADEKEERIIEAAVENAPIITTNTIYMVE